MSQTNEKPEEKIVTETIAPAENLDSKSIQIETAFGFQIRTAFSPEETAKVVQLHLQSLQLDNDSKTAQNRKLNSEASKTDEEARKLKLENDDTESSLPRKRFIIRSITIVGALVAFIGFAMLLRELYLYLTGINTLTPANLFTFLAMTLVGLLLPLGGKYLLELISIIRKP